MNKRVTVSIAVLCGLVAGLAIGATGMRLASRPSYLSPAQTRSGGFSLINPLLACDTDDNAASANLSAIKSALDTQVSNLIAAGKAKRVSIYVRDMNAGVWTGVNQNDQFIPASLLKVPVMIAFLKDAEDGQPPLSEELMLPRTDDANATETIKPAAPLQMGRSYPIGTLIEDMVEQSDNNAMNVLVDTVSTSSLAEVFSQFSVPVALTDTQNAVSPRDYMRFFRLLYNGTYLTHEDSQNALEVLTRVKYDAGLGAGVPSGVRVAHKFGEREVYNGSSLKTVQLHDCGIVYYPGLPYGICIMTEGSDIESLQSVIQTLSSTVYSEIDKGMLQSN